VTFSEFIGSVKKKNPAKSPTETAGSLISQMVVQCMPFHCYFCPINTEYYAHKILLHTTDYFVAFFSVSNGSGYV
jgi:hypothetical protein